MSNYLAIVRTARYYACIAFTLFYNSSFSQTAFVDSIAKILQSNLPERNKKSEYRATLRKYFYKYDSLATISFAKKAKVEAERINQVKYAPIAELVLGDAFSLVNNAYDAFTCYKNCYSLSEKYKDTLSIINAAQNLSYYFKLYGDQESAIKYSLVALKLSELTKSNRGSSINSMNVGHSLKALKRFSEALDYYRNSYVYAVLDSNITMIPNSLISIGNFFNESKNNIDSAFFYYFKAKDYCEKHPSERRSLAIVLANIADLYFKEQRIDSATNIYLSSLKLAREIPDARTITYTLTQIGKLLAIGKDYANSNDTLFEALRIAEKGKFEESKIEIYKTLAENYFEHKDFKEAYQYSQLAQNYVDTFFSIESMRISNGLQIIYEVEKKQNEILKLGILNAKEKQRSLDLRIQRDSISYNLQLTSEQEKLSEANNKILFQQNQLLDKSRNAYQDSLQAEKYEVIATRLEAEKSTDRFIGSIMFGALLFFGVVIRAKLKSDRAKLKSDRTKLKNELELKDAAIKLKDAELLVGRLQIKPHTIINMLVAIEDEAKKGYENAKPYLDSLKKLLYSILTFSDKEQISLSEEVEVAKKYMELEMLRKKFEYNLNIPSDVVQESILSMPIVILPFIENSIFHGFSFPEENKLGLLTINIIEEHNQMLISIEDNGIGRKAASLVARNENKKSMGMSITKERIEKYNSKYGIQTFFQTSDLDPGFRIEFNLFLDHAY